MKAAFRSQYAGPEGLTIQSVAVGVPGKKEVLIRVRAATVNRTDYAVLTGIPFVMRFFIGLRRPAQPITGTDFAGTVEAVGETVTALQPGQNVFGFDDTGLASHAEFLCIAADRAFPMPANASFETAAAACEAAHYAYNFIRKLHLQPGQAALVNGAGGGIGSALVQFLKYFGLSVTAVCRTDQVERVRALGADRVLDYTQEDFTEDNSRYDFVFDAVGKSRFRFARKILKPRGIYLSSEPGPAVENLWLPLLTIAGKQKVVFPLPSDIPGSLAFVSALIAAGKFTPLIDRTYPLEQIADAFAYVNTGEKTGNVLIRFPNSDGR